VWPVRSRRGVGGARPSGRRPGAGFDGVGELVEGEAVGGFGVAVEDPSAVRHELMVMAQSSTRRLPAPPRDTPLRRHAGANRSSRAGRWPRPGSETRPSEAREQGLGHRRRPTERGRRCRHRTPAVWLR
jgi:hypothetical protein